MKILIAGGGTGGHLFPGITIAKEISNRYPESNILFMGSRKRIESRVVSREGFDFVAISTFQMRTQFALKNILFLFSLIIGIVQSLIVIIRFRPTLILGLGGYISVSPVLAGYLLRVPLVIHEQNFSPGRANKFLSRFVDKVAVSFESSLRFFAKHKGVFTGNFVRAGLKQKVSKEQALEFLGLPTRVFTILIMGGSRGAHSINMVFMESVDYLKEAIPLEMFQIIHLTGKEDEQVIKEKYLKHGIKNYTLSFLDAMGIAYRAADVVVCRAGGTTTSELVYCGLPSIMIPYPFAVRDHQSENARFLERHKAAVAIQEHELSAEKLAKRITYFYSHREVLKEMAEKSRELANNNAVDTMLELIECIKRG